MSLQIQVLPPAHGSQRVTLAGRLDTHTFEDLDERLAPLLTRQLHSLVLDLAGLDYISSAGIRSIFKARKQLGLHGGKVLLVNPQAQIRKVLDIVQAVPMHEIFVSTAEADAYLDAMQRKVLHGDGGL